MTVLVLLALGQAQTQVTLTNDAPETLSAFVETARAETVPVLEAEVEAGLQRARTLDGAAGREARDEVAALRRRLVVIKRSSFKAQDALVPLSVMLPGRVGYVDTAETAEVVAVRSLGTAGNFVGDVGREVTTTRAVFGRRVVTRNTLWTYGVLFEGVDTSELLVGSRIRVRGAYAAAKRTDSQRHFAVGNGIVVRPFVAPPADAKPAQPAKD